MGKKPVVGVVPLFDEDRDSLWMLPGYLDGLHKAGALGMVFPLEMEEADALQLLSMCDGLLMTGGHDVDPSLYKEEKLPQCGPVCTRRDRLEGWLFRRALETDLPVLGICRGIQLMNVLMGGTLYQALPMQLGKEVNHHGHAPYDVPVHGVCVLEGTPLYTLAGQDRLEVNSYHHQGIRALAPGLRPMALADDGLVEAVWAPGHRFVWAVQWHPEFAFRKDPQCAALFGAFAGACREGMG